jgi:6-pyruvoyltetrahydropterin/6-carboxytetrahydropterin synthase
MYIIRKEFSFSASHCLDHLPPEHPCSRIHGHNYVVTVELRAQNVDLQTNFVRDYRALDVVKNYLDLHFDHHHLNRVVGYPPTAENMAYNFFQTFKKEIPELYAVEVSETNKTSARYEQDIN